MAFSFGGLTFRDRVLNLFYIGMVEWGWNKQR